MCRTSAGQQNYDVLVRSDTNSLLEVEANIFSSVAVLRMNLKTEETCCSQLVFKNQCWITAWKFLKRFLMFSSPNADLLHWAGVLFCLIVEEFFGVLRIKGRTTKYRSFVAISHNYQLLCASACTKRQRTFSPISATAETRPFSYPRKKRLLPQVLGVNQCWLAAWLGG